MADSLIDTVKRGIAMPAWGNFSLAVLIKRRVSLIIVMAVCSLRQLFLPMDNKMSLVSGLGDVCLSKTAVRCLNVAPGKLSIWMSSIFLFGIRAKFESPVIIMGFLIGRDHIEVLSIEEEKREGEVGAWRLGSSPTGARATSAGVVRGGVRGQG